MWNRKELKAKGKAAFKRNYWPSVLVALVLTLVTGGGASSAYKRSHSSVTTNLDVSNMTTEQAIAILATIAIASLVFILILVLVDMFITNPLSVGAHRFFVRNSEGDRPGFSMLFSAYQDGHFGRVFVTMFLRDLYIFLWSLLLVIPGMIKAYSYRMVPYLLADHPEMSASEIITKSREMMNGH